MGTGRQGNGAVGQKYNSRVAIISLERNPQFCIFLQSYNKVLIVVKKGCRKSRILLSCVVTEKCPKDGRPHTKQQHKGA